MSAAGRADSGMVEGPLAGGVPSIPPFRPAAADVFARRARRLLALAPGHAMEGYLRFAAALAHAQDADLRAFPQVPLPDSATLTHCGAHGLPPLSADGHRRDPAWREGLARLLTDLNHDVLPARAAGIVAALAESEGAALERDAAHLLGGAYTELDPGRAPLIAAGLQLYWVRMALTLEAGGGRGADARHGLCPLCGSPPVASVVRSGGAEQGLRYLACSLCAGEWHVVRVKCSECGSTQGISYLFVADANDAVRAECCEACGTYLKILYLEKDNRMEPYADDLATLALDLLVHERGYARRGPNLLFLPGGDSAR
jgi:FdhE protein